MAGLVDDGTLRTTVGDDAEHRTITAAHLREAHEFVASHRAVGKVVLAGWE